MRSRGRLMTLVRRLSSLYPRAFREQLAPDLLDHVETELRRVEAESGRMAAIRFGWRTLLAMIPAIALEWTNVVRMRTRVVRDASRGAGRWSLWLDAAGMEWRQAQRGLAGSPGFVAVVVITLGLGVGANTAMFELTDQLLLRAPPYVRDPSSVSWLEWERTRRDSRYRTGSFSYPAYSSIVSDATGLEAVAAQSWRSQVARLGDRPRLIMVMAVTASYWTLFDARPVIGRFFGDGDDELSAEPVAVLSNEFWRSEFGGSPDVLGRTVPVGGLEYTVIGVAPARFRGLDLLTPEVFVPLAVAATTFIGPDYAQRAGTTWLSVLVRHQPGGDAAAVSSIERALTGHLARYSGEDAARAAGVVATFEPLMARAKMHAEASRIALWLLGMSVIVVLVASANIATLMLGRELRRRRDSAVRAALGVRRARIVVRPVIELLLLAGPAGVLAVLLGNQLVAVIAHAIVPDAGTAVDSLAPRSMAWGILLIVISGLLSVMIPAVQAQRVDVGMVLRYDGARSGRTRSAVQAVLPGIQAALAAMLLVGAGLFVRSVAQIRSLDLGYDTSHVVVVNAETSGALDAFSAELDWSTTMRRLADRAAGLAGVDVVALATSTPFGNTSFSSLSLAAGESEPAAASTTANTVSPEYFSAIGTPILQGRGLLASDGAGAPSVMVVSRTLARRLWPDGEAVGRCVFVVPDTSTCVEVVGVAQDIRSGEIRSDEMLQYYRPRGQAEPGMRETIVVRTASAGAEIEEAIRRELQAAVPASVFVEVHRLDRVVGEQARTWYVGAGVFSAFGALALVMAALGVFSVTAYDVAQRTREFCVRIALGAGMPDLVTLVLRRGLTSTLSGLAIGLFVASLLAGRLEGLLFGVGTRDPATFLIVLAVLPLCAAAAALIPMWRAGRVDPQSVLRSD